MNYEKAYKDALERAKGIYKDTWNSYILNIFPELAESEDERIRKKLINRINGLWENDAAMWPSTLEEKNKYIAWLEKQTNQSEEDETIELLTKDM